jgi:hypothetical protein
MIISDIKMPTGQQSFSDAGDVMLTSSSQNKGIRVTYRTPPTKDLLKSQTMAIIAMMRSLPKDGYHRGCSNRHY